MSQVEERINALGLKLPECPIPVAAYVVAKKQGNLIFVSGQTAQYEGKPMYIGKVGREVSLEEAYESAKLCALRCISELNSVADLDKIQILKVLGFVNAVPEYRDHPKVMNGASELLEKVSWQRIARKLFLACPVRRCYNTVRHKISQKPFGFSGRTLFRPF